MYIYIYILYIRTNSARSSTSRTRHTASTCHTSNKASHTIKTRNKGSTVMLCHGSIKHNCTTAAIRVRPVPTLHSCIPTLQDFTSRKPQHLQAGFRLLLSLRLFLQALLAICGFFRFCCSCFYRVRLQLQRKG